MAVERVLHMNGGNGESSYAQNSSFQKSEMLKVKPLIEATIKDMYNINGGFPECLKIADLGCSSGPNTLLAIYEIIDIVHGCCKQNTHNKAPPEFQVFLNDLPENDFNTVFKSLSCFFDKLKKEKGDQFGPTFILAMPGSFYQRLFPSKSLHFVHSSFSLHWLSQVPEGLENNKGNIYMSKTSPPKVLEAYSKQFHRDFFTFLHLRSKEIIPGGRMVLTFVGRSLEDPSYSECCFAWDLLTKSLFEMEAQGLVKEDDVDSFNIPVYTPYKDEVEAIIQKEGSFNLQSLKVLEETLEDVRNHNENDKRCLSDKQKKRGTSWAKLMRAITEPLLATHFGDSIIDGLFLRYAENVAQYVSMEGLVKEADIDSFNMPYYTPYKDEVESIIQKEGSFSIIRLEVFEETLVDVMNHNENGREYTSEKNTIIAIFAAKGMRAVTEPILASHFGDSIIDSLFGRYTKNVVDYMSMKTTMPINIVISLTKK